MTGLPLSKFIVDEPPMVVFRGLVRVFGLQEGHLIQHLHYWLHLKSQDPARYKDHFIDGRYWVHWTMVELRQQVPLGATSSDPYKRIISKLRDQGVLLVAKHGQAWDQTNWYSIDYNEFALAIGALSVQSLNGGDSTDASAATPPLHERKSKSSKRGQAADHYRTTETTSQKTTTTEGVVEVDLPVEDAGRGNALDLTRVPEALWPEVSALLSGRQDGQRFADLLASGLVRSTVLPEARQIHAPIRWLKKLLADPGSVDFSAADALAAQREAAANERRLALERHAKEVAETEARRAAELLRAEAAQRAIAAMSDSERKDLIRKAGPQWIDGWPSSPRRSIEMENAVMAGQLPRRPLDRIAVFRALAEGSKAPNNAGSDAP